MRFIATMSLSSHSIPKLKERHGNWMPSICTCAWVSIYPLAHAAVCGAICPTDERTHNIHRAQTVVQKWANYRPKIALLIGQVAAGISVCVQSLFDCGEFVGGKVRQYVVRHQKHLMSGAVDSLITTKGASCGTGQVGFSCFDIRLRVSVSGFIEAFQRRSVLSRKFCPAQCFVEVIRWCHHGLFGWPNVSDQATASARRC